MKKKMLAACIAACALALVAGCSSGGGDDGWHGIGYDPAKWVIEGTTVVRYTGAEADVRIPNGVTIIGEEAFKDCKSLKSVTIPASVKSIGKFAFWGCTSLAEVKYGGTLSQWCQMYNDWNLMENATSVKISDGIDLKSLKTLEIPSDVTSIRYSAFYGCNSLASVTIPGSVKSIEVAAFRYCTSLASVTIPASVKSIGEWAFDGCMSLTEVKYGGSLSQWCQMDNDWGLLENATSVKMSDGSDLKSLKTLEIPSDVTSIGGNAFYGCESLESVTIPASVTSIGIRAFQNCTSLASVEIPESVTSIGNGAFSWCTSLAEVKYGGTAEQWKQIDIGSSVFYRASEVKIYDKEGKEIKE